MVIILLAGYIIGAICFLDWLHERRS